MSLLTSLFLRNRQEMKELMDQPSAVSKEDMVGSLVGIDRVNKLLNGAKLQRLYIREVFTVLKKHKERHLRFCDIGTGSAFLAEVIVDEAKKAGFQVHIVAVELNRDIASYAKKKVQRNPSVTIINGDARAILKAAAAQDTSAHTEERVEDAAIARSGKYDFITSTLFLHHFDEKEVTDWLMLMDSASRYGWLINDLERNVFALLGIKAVGRMISKNRVFLHDSALSVKRSYTEKEWRKIAARVAGKHARVMVHWPWRVMILRLNHQKKNRKRSAS